MEKKSNIEPVTGETKFLYFRYFKIAGHLSQVEKLLLEKNEIKTSNFEIDLALIVAIRNKYLILLQGLHSEIFAGLDVQRSDPKSWAVFLKARGFTKDEQVKIIGKIYKYDEKVKPKK